MERRSPAKHTLYFELRTALEQEGCPICRLGLRAVDRYFDALTYEGVNDPIARAELRAARGFCYPHAWQFAIEVHDGLGTALIYRDILIHVLRTANRLGAVTGSRQPQDERARRPVQLGPSAPCPACRTLERASHRYLDTLLIHLGEAEMQSAFLAGPGLCRPHLSAALSLVGRPAELELLREDGRRRFALSEGRPTDKKWVRDTTARLWGEPRGAAGEAAVWGAGLAGLEEPRPDSPHLCALCAAPEAPNTSAAVLQLCSAHAWRLVPAMPPDQAVPALISGLQAASEALQTDVSLAALRPQSWWRRLRRKGLPQGQSMASHLRPAGACPACEQARASAARRLAQVGTKGPLCLPHLLLALAAMPTADEPVLDLQPTLVYWHTLKAELDEYIRKQDYRFRHEPMGAETDAPWRAVAAMAGERGS
ncbi:MAG: DUF6062 family protein [Anaerolineae bacterium]